MIRDHLEDFKERTNMIIMFTDAYDILFYKNQSNILKLFKESNANIVFGAEEFLTPEIESRNNYPKVGKMGKLHFCSRTLEVGRSKFLSALRFYVFSFLLLQSSLSYLNFSFL